MALFCVRGDMKGQEAAFHTTSSISHVMLSRHQSRHKAYTPRQRKPNCWMKINSWGCIRTINVCVSLNFKPPGCSRPTTAHCDRGENQIQSFSQLQCLQAQSSWEPHPIIFLISVPTSPVKSILHSLKINPLENQVNFKSFCYSIFHTMS